MSQSIDKRPIQNPVLTAADARRAHYAGVIKRVADQIWARTGKPDPTDEWRRGTVQHQLAK